MPTLESTKSQPKQNYRNALPAGRCAFCKEETDKIAVCEYTGFECFSTCSKCRAMGAPIIHAPSKMITVCSLDDKGKIVKRKMRFPQAARKYAYKCRHCSMWHDKTLLHASSHHRGDHYQAMCSICHDKHKLTICQSCHAATNINPSCKDSKGYLCENCFRRNCQFTPLDKGEKMRVIKVNPNARRTFGVEIEINRVHRAQNLVDELGQLNINGVEFDVKRDGSIHHGFEIASYPAELPVLMLALKELFSVTRQYRHNYENAGMHVHVQQSDLNILNIFKWFAAVEHFHYSFLPPYRHTNQYCKPLIGARCSWNGHDTTNTIDTILGTSSEEEARQRAGRRGSFNMGALDKYGTIEYRAHHATTDYREVMHFLKFLNCLYDRAQETLDEEKLREVFIHSEACRSAGEEPFRMVCQALRLPKHTADFLYSRKVYYETNAVDHKDNGTLSRYRYTNGRTSEDIRRSAEGRNYRIGDLAIVPTNASETPRRVRRYSWTRIERDDRSGLVLSHMNIPAIDRAYQNPSRIFVDDEVLDGTRSETRNGTGLYLVSDGSRLWACATRAKANRIADNIRRDTLAHLARHGASTRVRLVRRIVESLRTGMVNAPFIERDEERIIRNYVDSLITIA